MVLFLIQAIIISLTGVMAPGPITAVVVGAGARSPHAGVMVAIGHGMVEFPLMALIYYGLGGVLELDQVRSIVFVLGGIVLLLMGADMLRSIRRADILDTARSKAPLLAGIMLSLGNAYFLVWWATVGASLITKAVTFGIAGVLAFAAVHWLCDLAWYYLLSTVTFRGGNLLGVRFQKTVFAVCGLFLIVFGVMFLRDAIVGAYG